MYFFISCEWFRQCKRIILDFRKSSPNDLDELKTQLNILDHGYAVDLSKVTNSLLQGTLSVLFSLLELPATNRGYFWNEEDNEGKSVFDLLGDCFDDDITQLECSLKGDQSKEQAIDGYSDPKDKDMNEIDLDLDAEEEDNEETVSEKQSMKVSNSDQDEESAYIGPARPPPPVFVTSIDNASSVTSNSGNTIGPVMPKEILEMINQGIPVQVEEESDFYNTATPTGRKTENDGDEDDNLIGPSLPGKETRIPTEDAYAQIDRLREEEKNKTNPKRVCIFDFTILFIL